jgi:hypothetical protein
MITGIDTHELQVLLHGLVRSWVGLAASVLALPGFAAALTLDEALRLAESNAPSLDAQDAKIQAASVARLFQLVSCLTRSCWLGLQNYPIGGPDRWSVDRRLHDHANGRRQAGNAQRREAQGAGIEVANGRR